jgi:formate dehydrogenase iron-sulfur subunit
VEDRLTPYNWLFIQEAAGEYNGQDFEINIPRRCMHCRNAPCSNLCPFGAAFTQGNGIVRIHPEVCMGGAKCKAVCPWHIPERQSGVGLHLDLLPQYAGNGVMYKCDRCYQRLEEGELPACIEVCPEDVQQIGPRQEIVEKAHQLAGEINGFIYGEDGKRGHQYHLCVAGALRCARPGNRQKTGIAPPGTGTRCMASANRMALALAIAPVAGVAGAVARFLSLGKTDKSGKGATMIAKANPVLKALYGAAAVTALFTGFGNMPLWGRYYVADAPGLGWSGDFFINVNVHILAGSLLLGIGALCHHHRPDGTDGSGTAG